MGWKLSARAFARFWDAHAWVGVVSALVLYVMFWAGSITLFHEQLEEWEEPLAQHVATDEPSLERAALPGALFAMMCLAGFLPLGESLRFTLGFALGVTLWVTAMCLTLLAASGTRAWLACLGAVLVLGVLALAIPH